MGGWEGGEKGWEEADYMLNVGVVPIIFVNDCRLCNKKCFGIFWLLVTQIYSQRLHMVPYFITMSYLHCK